MEVSKEKETVTIWSLRTYHVLFIIVSIPFFWNLATERYFSADGAGYFVNLLDGRWFLDFAWSRNHAVYLTQWPIVLGVHFGLEDMRWLKFLFGFGLYLPCAIAWFICTWALEEKQRVLLLFPLFSMLALTLTGDAIMTGEHHTLVYLAWPILFLALDSRCFTWSRAITLVILLLFHTRLYESAMATGALFAFIFIIRGFFADAKNEKLLSGLFFLLSIVAIFIAIHAVVFPRDPDNRSSFFMALVGGVASPAFITAAVFIIPCLIGIILRWRWLLIFGFAAFLITVCWRLIAGLETHAGISFSTRTLSLWFLPSLMLLACWMALFPPILKKNMPRYIVAFLIIASIVHTSASVSWLRFRTQFKQVLHQEKGYVARESTNLGDSNQSWGWTSPLLSYIWSDGMVDTIILNDADTDWEPFDPKKETVLDDYVKARIEGLSN